MSWPLPPVEDVPPMQAPVHVVGDVHLTEEEPHVVRAFTDYVDRIACEGGTLVLLGDIFDYWVGREQAKRQPIARHVVQHLAAATTKGLRLAFLTGNRDYAFNGVDGLDIDLWPDVVRTQWGDRIVVLSHGDLLCQGDTSYLRMRSFLRGTTARALLRYLPYSVTTYAATGLRDLSDRATKRKSRAEMDIDYGAARRWLDRYQADALVVGHVHTGVHQQLPGERTRDVYVLKDWSHAPNEILFDGRTIRLQRI